MSWHDRRSAARRRAASKYDTAEAEAYGKLQGLGWLTADEERAYLADLGRVVQFVDGAKVLDVGAGTGVMCSLLRQFPGIELTALEPSAAMLAVLQKSTCCRSRRRSRQRRFHTCSRQQGSRSQPSSAWRQ